MDGHDRLLAAFLAGDLDPAEARRWDEHLLECERCWRSVREDRAGRQAAELLRQPAPAGLADRVAFAVEVAAAGGTTARRQSRQQAHSRRGRHGRAARWPASVRWPRHHGDARRRNRGGDLVEDPAGTRSRSPDQTRPAAC